MEIEEELQAEKGKTQVATDALVSEKKKILKLQKELEDREKEQLGIFCEESVAESGHDAIGLKKIGVIDSAPFIAEAKRLSDFSVDWNVKAKESLSFWDKIVHDPHWNPFKIIVNKDGQYVVCHFRGGFFCEFCGYFSCVVIYVCRYRIKEMKICNSCSRSVTVEFIKQ